MTSLLNIQKIKNLFLGDDKKVPGVDGCNNYREVNIVANNRFGFVKRETPALFLSFRTFNANYIFDKFGVHSLILPLFPISAGLADPKSYILHAVSNRGLAITKKSKDNFIVNIFFGCNTEVFLGFMKKLGAIISWFSGMIKPGFSFLWRNMHE